MDIIMTVLGFFPELLTKYTGLLDKLPEWVDAITYTVTGASMITMLTATKVDDKIIGTILKVLNFVSLNVLKNKNADDTE